MVEYRFTATRGATWDEPLTCEKCGWSGTVSAVESRTSSSTSTHGGRMSDAADDASSAAQNASMLAARIAPCPRCGAGSSARAAHLRGTVFVGGLTAGAGAGAAVLRSISTPGFWIVLVIGVILALVTFTRLYFWSTVKRSVKYTERAAAPSAAPSALPSA